MMSYPPTLSQVESFVKSNRQPLSVAKEFYRHYEARKWLTVAKKPLRNWKEELARWMARASKRVRQQGY